MTSDHQATERAERERGDLIAECHSLIVAIAVRVDGGITPRTSPTKPDVKLSPHPAPSYS